MIFFSASLIGREPSRDYFVVWNVGQGQWTTWVQQEECWHFDMGGESLPFARAQKVCEKKLNRIFLSHWDLDHIGGLKKAPRFFSRLCLARPPIGSSTERKKRLLPKEVCPLVSLKLWEWSPAKSQGARSTNERSRIFATKDFLVSGDSPQKEERIWSADSLLPASRLLVLGHHGSRTSTSDFLLGHLIHLHQAVCSARWSRYHHPHAETQLRLKQAKVPLLRTEDWGHIWFEL